MSYRVLSLAELQKHGLATPQTVAAARRTQQTLAGFEMPPALKAALDNPKQFAADLASGIIPVAVANWLTDRVIQNAKDLTSIRNNIEAHDRLPKADQEPTKRDQWNREYLKGFKLQNTMVFWCMVIPVLRARLKGKVKAPSFGVLRSSKSDGMWPNEADLTTFLVSESDALIKDLKQQGVLLDGLVETRGPNNTYTQQVAGLGAVPVFGIPAAAVAVVALITVYLSSADVAATIRTISADIVAGKLAATDPKAAQRYKDSQAKWEQDKDKTGFGGTLRTVVPWVVGGIGLLLVGPTIVEAITAKVVKDKFHGVSALGCGPECSCMSCSHGRKAQLDGLGNCSCGGASHTRRR